MSAHLPKVAGQWIDGPGVQAPSLRLDTPAWFNWLAAESTRGFSYPITNQKEGYISGYMTVRKERRARGGDYWWAYRRGQGRVRKIYLGRTERVTLGQLEVVARAFAATALPPS